jgi:hypothetical protein
VLLDSSDSWVLRVKQPFSEQTLVAGINDLKKYGNRVKNRIAK